MIALSAKIEKSADSNISQMFFFLRFSSVQHYSYVKALIYQRKMIGCVI